MSEQKAGPTPTELEISVFGPGYGESVLVHVGHGRWVAIDSCIDPKSKRPRALDYLEEIGVDPATAVDFLLASHWHDDHVRGISELLQACESAVFSCAQALTNKEFLQLAALFEDDSVAAARSSQELHKCLVDAAERSERSSRPLFKVATSDKVLWAAVLGQGGSPISVTLTALSPSDEMNLRAIRDMADAFVALSRGASPDRIASSRPNHVATAVRLDIGERSLLLGSDLEDHGDPLVGWAAVLLGTQSLQRVSETFKVAHHGSESGHLDAVWSQMVRADPLCLLTPFRHGGHEIPTPADRARILALTSRAYISASPHRHAPVSGKRTKKIEALIGAATKSRRQAAGPVGHVRWRASITDPTDPGQVELFDGAMELASV